MLTFDEFQGINNIKDAQRLSDSELTEAVDVDIDNSGAIVRRPGYSLVDPACHKNIWESSGFVLATRDGGELVSLSGGVATQLHPALGVARVWYSNWPDGRTAFSNGSICGVTDGVTMTGFGIEVPASTGTAYDVAGDLHAGGYRHHIAYVRLADGLEGGLAYGPVTTLENGGLLLMGLPFMPGYKINVYLTGANDEEAFLAGSTLDGSFSYAGSNASLVAPAKTQGCSPAPVGTVLGFWRGRALVAVGSTLFASMAGQWELFDLARDFKQFTAPITALAGVDYGIYVGTEKELTFLSGSTFDQLTYRRVLDAPVVLGSCVPVPGDRMRSGEGVADGVGMVCIAGRRIFSGRNDGAVSDLSGGRYQVDASITEVCAAFRDVGGLPQYIAAPL